MKAIIIDKKGESLKIISNIPDNVIKDDEKTKILKTLSLTKKDNTLLFLEDSAATEEMDYALLEPARKKTRKSAVPAEITAYTDGGYHIYKNEGAYAFVLLQNGKIIKKEAAVIRNETNNRGELKAILAAVRNCPDEATVTINSDSQYAINTLRGEWARKKNTDLFDEWETILARKKVSVRFNWVRGHDGNKYNEMCDQMCNEAVGYDLNSWIPKNNAL